MRVFILCAALALAACSRSEAEAPIAEQWRAMRVTATPVELGAARVGRLVYRGGLDLTSDDEGFGGLSGLEVLDNNRLLAVSDDGKWFEAHLLLDDDGALVGAEDFRVAFMRDEHGEVFAHKRAGDAEDLAQMPDGRFAVSFEQTQTIRFYDLNRDGPFGAAVSGPPLDAVARLPRNEGLEALTALSDGSLLAGAEGEGRRSTPLWRARPDEDEAPVLMRFPLQHGFALTSMDRLPEGGVVALERFYAPVIGARARIVRFPESALGGERESLDGIEELGSISPPLTVDNFEGVSAVRAASGATRIYVVSDNNFSSRQRTLLLAFDLAGEPAAPRTRPPPSR
jgi:hypothetical protein